MTRRNQKGMASLLVTMILVTILSTVAVAFATIMNRELQKSVNNQIGQAAYNAAASGINDAISYLKDNPNTNVGQCSDLVGTNKPLSAASNLSGDGATKYTCVLINTRPLDIIYQSIPSNESQIIKTSFSATTGKLMVSWQSSDRTYNKFVPDAQKGQLFDETAWKTAKYTPLLKVSLYPIPADTKDMTSAVANARTYYLYPTVATGFAVNTLSYATTAGTLKSVECGVKNNNGQFNGTADYDCNLIITNLPTTNAAGYIYYLRATPVYGTADVKFRANDSTVGSSAISFIGTQAIVDVTAQSSNATKRLQARVDSSGLNGTSQNITATDDSFPEYAIRSANTVCKRVQKGAAADFPAYITDTTRQYCGSDLSPLAPLSPPKVAGSCSDGRDYNTANCGFNLEPNNGKITYCKLLIDGSEKADCVGLFPAGPSTAVKVLNGSFGIGSGDHSYSMCVTNAAGQTCANGTFSIAPQPTPPPFLTRFWKPDQATCTARYGGISHWNCFDFSGNDLPGQCSVNMFNVNINVSSSSSGGSFTLGNDGATADGAGSITCTNSGGTTSCNLGQTCSSTAPPASLNIGYFLVEGPYDNGTNKDGNYCPDNTHQYLVCITWAVTASSSLTPVSCTANWYAPHSSSVSSNSSPKLTIFAGSTSGGNSWTLGSNNSDFLLDQTTVPSWGGNGQLICKSADNSVTATVGPSTPSQSIDCYNTASSTDGRCISGYWYHTPNCVSVGAYNKGKCLY